jgi:hypothetical protein
MAKFSSIVLGAALFASAGLMLAPAAAERKSPR